MKLLSPLPKSFKMKFSYQEADRADSIEESNVDLMLRYKTLEEISSVAERPIELAIAPARWDGAQTGFESVSSHLQEIAAPPNLVEVPDIKQEVAVVRSGQGQLVSFVEKLFGAISRDGAGFKMVNCGKKKLDPATKFAQLQSDVFNMFSKTSMKKKKSTVHPLKNFLKFLSGPKMAESLNLLKLEEALRLWSNKCPALSDGHRKMLEVEDAAVISDVTGVELAARDGHVIGAPSHGLDLNATLCDGLNVEDTESNGLKANHGHINSDKPNGVNVDEKNFKNQKIKTEPSSPEPEKKSQEEESEKLKTPVVVLEPEATPDKNEFTQKSEASEQEPTVRIDCSKCSLKFPNREQLHLHNLLIHVNFNPDPVAAAVTELTISGFRCGPCKVTFDVESKMRSHLNSVHSVKSAFACILCSLTFATARGMQLHIELSHQPFKCKVCLKSFTEKTLLQDHLDKQHRVNDDGFSCNFCSRYFYRHLPPQSNVTLHL